jgi:hypothetical protein
MAWSSTPTCAISVATTARTGGRTCTRTRFSGAATSRAPGVGELEVARSAPERASQGVGQSLHGRTRGVPLSSSPVNGMCVPIRDSCANRESMDGGMGALAPPSLPPFPGSLARCGGFWGSLRIRVGGNRPVRPHCRSEGFWDALSGARDIASMGCKRSVSAVNFGGLAYYDSQSPLFVTCDEPLFVPVLHR